MKQNERLNALRILIQLLRDKTPLSQTLSNSSLSPLTKEICFGVCRYYYRLQTLLNQLLTKEPKAIEVRLVLLIGLYQLHFLRMPDYAVVKETVALVERIKKTWAKGLVNAVLRNYCRQRETLLAAVENDEPYKYNHPEWFISAVQKAWPENWQAILQANDLHPPMTLRVNSARTTVQNYITRLESNNIKSYTGKYVPTAIRLDKPCPVEDLPGFVAGDVSVQDEAAQLAATLLALQPGLRVLDACCAPGGKTCHMLETQPHLSACLALDVDEKRLLRVKDNLNRLHLSASLTKGDAQKPQTWWDGQPFDRILLDAPCSATGVIRRHPDIKLTRTVEEVSKATALQKKLLHALWPLLKPGGYLVYATCSILPEENEQQIAQFIAAQNDCQFINIKQPWGRQTGHGWQVLPGEAHMDGFFYSVLSKQ